MADAQTGVPPGPRLSDADSLMWRIAADPVLRSPVTVVGLLDAAPDVAMLEAAFERGGELLPGLRSRIVAPPPGSTRPRWEPVAGFTAGHHIRRVGATAGGLRGVLDLAEPDVMAPFDDERPPWSLVVVEGLPADRAAFILRFHHAVTDGMGGLHAAAQLFDRRRRPRAHRKATAEQSSASNVAPPAVSGRGVVRAVADRTVTAARDLASGARSVANDPLGTATGSLRLVRSLGRLVAAAPGGSALLAGRGLDRYLHVFEVSLPELRAAARSAGGTVNDALLAAVGGAFTAYHDQHGMPEPTMSVTMPIDRRRPGDGVAGNHFVPARFALPVDEPDVATRLRIASAISRSWQHEPALDLSDAMAAALNRLPGPVVNRVFGGMLRTIDADVVDLAGLAEPSYLGGARVERMWAFSPPTGAAFSVTLLSHLDRACVAVACDRAAVPTPEVLAGCIEAGIDAVLALAPAPSALDPRARHDQEPAQ